MRLVPVERVINIAVNGCYWFTTSTQKGPFLAMLLSCSRGTYLIKMFRVGQKISWVSPFSGVHHHNKKDCEASATVKRVQDIVSRASKFLFPDKLVTKEIPTRRKLKVPKYNSSFVKGSGDALTKAKKSSTIFYLTRMHSF